MPKKSPKTIRQSDPGDPTSPDDVDEMFDGWIRVRYTDSQLLDSMRDAVVDGVLRMSTYKKSPYKIVSPSHIQRRFGSWKNACAMIHVKDGRQDLGHTDEDLFENVRQVWLHKGDRPVSTDMANALVHTSVTGSEYKSAFSEGGYARRFTGWKNFQIKFQEWYLTTHPGEILPTGQGGASSSATTGKRLSSRQRLKILLRDGYTCQWPGCGLSKQSHPNVNLHVDHILPVSEGGTNHDENLQTLCATHNLSKGSKIVDMTKRADKPNHAQAPDGDTADGRNGEDADPAFGGEMAS